MIIWGEMNFYVECRHNIFIEVAHETIPIVGNRQFTNTKPRYPLREGSATFRGRGLGHWVGLKPSGGPIQTCKQVPTTSSWTTENLWSGTSKCPIPGFIVLLCFPA